MKKYYRFQRINDIKEKKKVSISSLQSIRVHARILTTCKCGLFTVKTGGKKMHARKCSKSGIKQQFLMTNKPHAASSSPWANRPAFIFHISRLRGRLLMGYERMIHMSDNKALVTGGWGGASWRAGWGGQVSCCDTDNMCSMVRRKTDVRAPTHPANEWLKNQSGRANISLTHNT